MLGDSREVAVLADRSDDDAIKALLDALGDRAEILLVEDWEDKVQTEYLEALDPEERRALIQEAMGVSLDGMFDALTSLLGSAQGHMSGRLDLDDMSELFEQE